MIVLAMAALLFAVPARAASENEVDNGQTQASVTFQGGELKLNSVPVLDFGTHAISPDQQELAADSVTPVTEVSDLRGNGKGWDLNVTLSPFTLSEGGAATLQGASINVTNPKVGAANGTVGTPPAAVSEVEIASDSTETPVLKAGDKAGMGVWNLTWYAADTKLNVNPGTAQVGKSVATLNWSLQSTP